MALSRAHVQAVSRAALTEVAELIGKDAEKVVALRRDGEVWVLDVDVVDMRPVPQSADFMATYRLRLDEAGNVLELHRVRRFVRAWVATSTEYGGREVDGTVQGFPPRQRPENFLLQLPTAARRLSGFCGAWGLAAYAGWMHNGTHAQGCPHHVHTCSPGSQRLVVWRRARSRHCPWAAV